MYRFVNSLCLGRVARTRGVPWRPTWRQTCGPIWGLLALALLPLSLPTAAGEPGPPVEAAAAGSGACAEPPQGRWRIVGQRRLPAEIYLQGFEIDAAGRWWLSGGRYGESALWTLPPQGSPRRPRRQELPEHIFAEGLSRRDGASWILSWRAGELRRWADGAPAAEVVARYAGQGWGLAWVPERETFVMSNGGSQLQWRAVADFALQAQTPVRRGRVPVPWLNELEWQAGALWANVWRSDELLRIDPDSGCVTLVLDLAGLWPPGERPRRAEVLNGVAVDPRDGQLWVSGKLWGRAFALDWRAPGQEWQPPMRDEQPPDQDDPPTAEGQPAARDQPAAQD